MQQSVRNDINGDSIVSVADRVILYHILAEDNSIVKDLPKNFSAESLDFDGDGILTIIDSMLLLELLQSNV